MTWNADNSLHLFTWYCLPDYLITRIPENFTGLCTLTLALDRFILVVFPFQSEQLLSTRNRLLAYSLLTALTFGITSYELQYYFRRIINSEYFGRCYHVPNTFFLASPQKVSFMFAASLYALPAFVSVLLYLRVGIV